MARLGSNDHNVWRSPGGALYFKIGIPPALRDRPEFRSSTGKPKAKITEPLGTYNPHEARALRDQKLAFWKRTFARMSSGQGLGPEDLKAEGERIRIETLESLRRPPDTWITLDDDRQTMEAKLAKLDPNTAELNLSTLEAQVAKGKAFAAAAWSLWNQIKDEIAKIGARHGIAIEKGTPLYKDIASAVLAAMNSAYDAHDAENTSATPPPAPVITATPPAPQNGNGGGYERFSEAFEHYITWLRDKQKVRPATIQGYTTCARRFIEFAKDPALGVVTIDQAQSFLDEVAKEASAGTVNLHHVVCKAVFEHSRTERHRFHAVNPFSFRRRRHRPKSKAKYTTDELNRFVASAVFTGRQIKPVKYDVASCLPWAMAIGLFSGLTLEEVCQLRPQDIRKEPGAGIVIYVQPEAAVSGELKRPARQRAVPLHPALEQLGLLKYMAALPRDSQWLFPGLAARTGKDKRSGAVGKAFNRWRKALGIERQGETLDFHSLRHTFGKAIEDVGIAPNDCARLMGHAVKGITASVYSGPELRRVAPLVASVTWEGLLLPK
jgi:integrase